MKLEKPISQEITLTELANLHDLLCDLVICIESYFGYNIVMVVGLGFFFIIFNCYYVLEILFGPDEVTRSLDENELVGVIMAQVMASSMTLISFVEVCNKTIRQNNNIAMNIHKLLNVSKSQEVKEKLRNFALQWRNRPIKFTAAGVFNLDRTLYLTVRFFVF